ncbi:MAG: AAA family ATPase [Cellvibrionaceae bacterium]
MDKNLIRFLRECYQEDTGRQTIWNIFKIKKDSLYSIPETQRNRLVSGKKIELDLKSGKQLYKESEKYRREKALKICHFFLVGEISVNLYGKQSSRKIFSPLFFYDAELKVTNNKVILTCDLDSIRVNETLIASLISDKNSIQEISSEILDMQAEGKESFVSVLNKYTQNTVSLNASASGELEKLAMINSQENIALIDNTILALCDRSISSRGIIDELSMLESASKYSTSLQALSDFDKNRNLKNYFSWLFNRCDFNNIPALLSKSQKRIIEKSSKSPFSVLQGPPGTGKSYTIASLALECFMRNETVLVVSKNEHAVDVVKDKLIGQFGLSQSAIMRAGVKDYHRDLKRFYDGIISGEGVVAPGVSKSGEINRVERAIVKKERLLEGLLKQANSDGKLLSGVESGDVTANFYVKLKLRAAEQRNKKHGLLYEKLKEIQILNKKKHELVSQHINDVYWKKINKMLKKHRPEIVKFRKALGARSSQRQEKIFSSVNFDVLLDSMPIWLCSLNALHKALPLQSDLFDLVIIDEATQCDIASCYPALQRASRALIVGDQKQLRHVSFLARSRQEELRDKCGLTEVEFSYRDHSMIDYAEKKIPDIKDKVQLDEHYRSVVELISFSNKMFYGSKLRIMTEKPHIESASSFELNFVEGGNRASGVNIKEAEAIINKLDELLQHQSVIPDSYKLSIGVLSFFSAQADYIQNQIYEKFGLEEIKLHKLRSGTPYSFQGEERDIMLISCAVDGDSSMSSYTYMNRPDVFNVAVTRSREKQIVFTSLPQKHMPAKSMLKQYLDFQVDFKGKFLPSQVEMSEAIKDMEMTLAGMGITVLRNYPVAGVEMDLVLLKNNQVLALDLIGFPCSDGQFESCQLERYKVFDRAGIAIMPLSYSGWRLRRKEVTSLIESRFVELQESNTITKLSSANLSMQWPKLLGENPGLANSVRLIEADLMALDMKAVLQQLALLIDQYKKVVWVLNEKLNIGELTFSRYMGAAEQVLLGGIDNISQILVIFKSMKHGTLEDPAVQALLAENHNAVDALESLALKWSKAKTVSGLAVGDLASAVSEVSDLIERVDNYE